MNNNNQNNTNLGSYIKANKKERKLKEGIY